MTDPDHVPAREAWGPPDTRSINRFCLAHGLRIADNPCISPDFCLDWTTLRAQLVSRGLDGVLADGHHRAAPSESAPAHDALRHYPASRFATTDGEWSLVDNGLGDHAWILLLVPGSSAAQQAAALALLAEGCAIPGGVVYPARWSSLLRLKNLVLAHDPRSTIFPRVGGTLPQRSLGVGARFTTMHWPAVAWTMSALQLSMNANQNSIPRELVYDVEAMLAGTLGRVAFPFIGAEVPEGHQGQSVEGMSHGAVLSFLKCGFHRQRLPWGFNADHQPIGGAFDAREAALVRGCVLASSITFDLSPELAQTPAVSDALTARAWCQRELGVARLERIHGRVAACCALEEDALAMVLCAVWPALIKMQRRDQLYAECRERAFLDPDGRRYLRELSIDELPGLTTPGTLATVLAVCAELALRIDFIAPAFGFQKNVPVADAEALESRLRQAWAICRHFGCSIGFHSGSGKSAANYRLCGAITEGNLEIKTSGRYTYEFGVALAGSPDAQDQALWREWWDFTRQLALRSAFAVDDAQRRLARHFIREALERAGVPGEPFGDMEQCRVALEGLSPDPNHMFWFEYNFLFVLAADGRAEPSCLGDHSPAGYRQRARFYAVSATTRLRYAVNVASYLIGLARHTGMVEPATADAAERRLHTYRTYPDLLADIGSIPC